MTQREESILYACIYDHPSVNIQWLCTSALIITRQDVSSGKSKMQKNQCGVCTALLLTENSHFWLLIHRRARHQEQYLWLCNTAILTSRALHSWKQKAPLPLLTEIWSCLFALGWYILMRFRIFAERSHSGSTDVGKPAGKKGEYVEKQRRLCLHRIVFLHVWIWIINILTITYTFLCEAVWGFCFLYWNTDFVFHVSSPLLSSNVHEL